jgi:hypothetical protein
VRVLVAGDEEKREQRGEVEVVTTAADSVTKKRVWVQVNGAALLN